MCRYWRLDSDTICHGRAVHDVFDHLASCGMEYSHLAPMFGDGGAMACTRGEGRKWRGAREGQVGLGPRADGGLATASVSAVHVHTHSNPHHGSHLSLVCFLFFLFFSISGDVVEGLWHAAINFTVAHSVKPRWLHGHPSYKDWGLDGLFSQVPSFNTNCEVASLAMLRSENVQKLHRFLDQKGGYFLQSDNGRTSTHADGAPMREEHAHPCSDR